MPSNRVDVLKLPFLEDLCEKTFVVPYVYTYIEYSITLYRLCVVISGSSSLIHFYITLQRYNATL